MNVVSPLTLTLDSALALSRLIGSEVAIDARYPYGHLTGTVAGTDILGRVALTDVTTELGVTIASLKLPMADVLSWTPVAPLKKGAHL